MKPGFSTFHTVFEQNIVRKSSGSSTQIINIKYGQTGTENTKQ